MMSAPRCAAGALLHTQDTSRKRKSCSMPWNNQSSGGGGWKSGGGGGPWGSGGGGGPWGQGPGGGNQPDLEEILKRGQDKVKQVMHGSGVPRSEEHTSELQSRENLVCR